jgi:hypothetical protein
MGKIKTSWSLFKCSLAVIVKNKRLLLFPVIEFLFIVIIAIFFLSPIFLWDSGHSITESAHWEALGEHYGKMIENKEITNEAKKEALFGKNSFAWGVLFYLISMFSATFFNVAFYNEIINGLNDKRVSILRGFKAALSKIKLIMIWSLFAGIVGIIIRTLEQRLCFIGRWIMALIGIAWSVASIFIIPVIIREDKSANPLKLLKTSALMLKKTWGETVIGYVGIGSFFSFLIFIPFLLLIGMFLIPFFIPEIGYLMGISFVLLLFHAIFIIPILVYFANVTHHIYRGALYVYASEGVVPGSFDEEMMNRAWKVKKERKG